VTAVTPNRLRAPRVHPAMRRLMLLPLALVLPALLLPATAFAARATVKTASTADGTVRVDQHGKSLYMFGKDRRGKSSCSGACAQNWPPLLTTSKPKAGSGVSASKLSTVKRSDGKTQVTYARHPLYKFIADQAAGDVNGQGLNAFGGIWSLLMPSGAKVSGTPSSNPMPSPSPSPSPSPGYPY
jgi:predicted lipoprotein with Yx(FWY)xxD motif